MKIETLALLQQSDRLILDLLDNVPEAKIAFKEELKIYKQKELTEEMELE